MTAEEQLVNRIHSAGSAGVKRADLRKEYGEIDTILQDMVSKGDVFVDKRKNTYYYFHKDHYIQSLLNSDPRFRLTYDMIKSLEESVNRSSKDVTLAVELLANNISNLAKLVTENGHETPAGQKRSMNIDEFKKEFDLALANSASSIGWVELAKIRNELCDKCNLASEEFYRLAGQVTEQYQDRYELSTGGQEGVMIRGLLHGFVRCI